MQDNSVADVVRTAPEIGVIQSIGLRYLIGKIGIRLLTPGAAGGNSEAAGITVFCAFATVLLAFGGSVIVGVMHNG